MRVELDCLLNIYFTLFYIRTLTLSVVFRFFVIYVMKAKVYKIRKQAKEFEGILENDYKNVLNACIILIFVIRLHIRQTYLLVLLTKDVCVYGCEAPVTSPRAFI